MLMKLVITIDDDIYDDYLKQGATLPKYGTEIDSLYEALWNGVPLPKGHGRLIDADAINIHDVSPAYGMEVYGVTQDDIEYEPTIIEADKESENETDS